MKNNRLERFVLFIFLGLLVIAGAGMTLLFQQTHREFATIKAREAHFQLRLTEAEAKLKEKEDTLHRLRHDPDFIERTIRQHLRYARPGELVFRFEEHE